MARYRTYFRDAAGICGRTEFDARDDESAEAIAKVLADSCSDRCQGFELWQDARQVADVRRLSSAPTLSELEGWQQAIAVRTEEAPANSAFTIATSRRLLERLKGPSGPTMKIG